MKALIERLLKVVYIRGDYANHAIQGTAIFSVLSLFVPHIFAFASVVLIMRVKEMYDARNPETHSADVWDEISGAAGAALGWLSALPPFYQFGAQFL